MRCFTNSIEEILNIIGFYVYLNLENQRIGKFTALFTIILSLQFVIRNTAPIAWIPLLFIKVFRDGAFV